MKVSKASSALKKVIESFPEKDLLIAQNSLANTAGIGYKVLQDTHIPIITSNENAANFITEFQLDKPENFIRFLMELAYAPTETVIEGINDVKEENLRDCISVIQSCKERYLFQLDNGDTNFDSILSDLQKEANKLEGKIPMYIKKIKEIDMRSRWKFFIKAKSALPIIDANNYLAKTALTAYVEANNAYVIIATQGNKNYQRRINAYENFISENFLKNDVCTLMHGYETSEEKKYEFWLKIPELKDQAYKLLKITNEILIDDDYDADNIDFS